MMERMGGVGPQNNHALSDFLCIQEKQHKEPDLLVMVIGQRSPKIKWDWRDTFQTEPPGTAG